MRSSRNSVTDTSSNSLLLHITLKCSNRSFFLLLRISIGLNKFSGESSTRLGLCFTHISRKIPLNSGNQGNYDTSSAVIFSYCIQVNCIMRFENTLRGSRQFKHQPFGYWALNMLVLLFILLKFHIIDLIAQQMGKQIVLTIFKSSVVGIWCVTTSRLFT